MAKKTTSPGKPSATAEVRHPIKAATLLYSAPGFILRGPIYMMFISMFAMLFYSCIATQDTLVSAPLTLQRQTVTVVAINGGLVERLDVKENDPVKQDQPLVVIQETIRAASSPEQEALERQIKDYRERLSTLTRDYDYRHKQQATEILNLENRQGTDVASLSNRIEQLKIEVESTTRALQNTLSDVGTAEATHARLKPLCDRRDIPSTQCDQAAQRASDLRRAADNARSAISNTKLSLSTAQNDYKKLTDPATRQRMLDDLGKLEEDYKKQSEQINKEIDDLEKRTRSAQTLVSGVRYGTGADIDKRRYGQDSEKGKTYYTVPNTVSEGIVTTVHVQRGQLIQPGAPLFTIVRNEAPLVARVLVQNKDIGLLKNGQDVKIKYYAYPFQEYGIQLGSIEKISVRPSSVAGETSLFEVIVALHSERVWHLPRQQGDEGRGKPLEIGLTGAAEIKTGEKRFIEVLFTPASKFFKGEHEGNGAASAEAGGSSSQK
ncbi:MAG: HlyD family efflux transporter periplasmic adaptor subunit [Rhodospirillaceae bacterium]